ncbi:MAG: Putative protein-methionine-sulfoxide reductase subunit YedZ1 [Candidatus Moanabacter tarae]|uniref:Oxidoreductase molybdopterin-binding domain-containing protein n=1 Tax=Candidatus Moanibacter tarae TaxID=2200854 RepID=A0A2Z4ARR9_9BACT|nr:MAG: Putative protein-methionine-sulfoxide reductase subunit YedZ1 [Candidatus Moanabacter tarae]|tara:strand:- start:22639 stop:23280 length:642 start_codon:yes stop_codon:yes gene_type:complete
MSESRSSSAKERWAAKQVEKGAKALAKPLDSRLPAGQHLTEGFPVLDLGIQPVIPLSEWKLKIGGKVENPIALNWNELQELPMVSVVSDFHCVTTWSKFDCRWNGVPFTMICDLVNPLPEAAFVFFTSYDDYTVNVPLSVLLDDDVLIATEFEGRPLSRKHGGPARIIVPKLYAWKGAKFVKQIHFLEKDRLGYWESRGFSNTADPFTEDRYS